MKPTTATNPEQNGKGAALLFVLRAFEAEIAFVRVFRLLTLELRAFAGVPCGQRYKLQACCSSPVKRRASLQEQHT